MKFQMFRKDNKERLTFRSAHHYLQQTRRPSQYTKTSCNRCFMAIQLEEGFSTSVWTHLKVQRAAPNVNLQRKSMAEWCALSQTAEAARKINHEHLYEQWVEQLIYAYFCF